MLSLYQAIKENDQHLSSWDIAPFEHLSMATYEHNEHIKHAEEDFSEDLEYEHVAYIMLDHIGYHMEKNIII